MWYVLIMRVVRHYTYHMYSTDRERRLNGSPSKIVSHCVLLDGLFVVASFNRPVTRIVDNFSEVADQYASVALRRNSWQASATKRDPTPFEICRQRSNTSTTSFLMSSLRLRRL